MHSHSSSFSVFPVVSRFITGIFLLSIRSMQGFSVGAVGFRSLMVRCGDDPRMYFVQSRTVTRGTVDCTFVRANAWLDFSQDLVSLVVQKSSRAKEDAVTVRLSPQLALPVSQRTHDHVPDQCDNKSGAPPHTTPTGSTARVLVSSDSSTEGPGLLELDPLSAQAPSSCEHLFPLLEGILSNQDA